MTIKEVAFGTALYQLGTQLRDEVLRRPLGLVLSADDVAGEDRQLHIVALENDEHVVGTIILNPLSDILYEIRGVAVAPRRQGSGLGTQLVFFAEMLASVRNAKSIEMKARITARAFYEKLGYRAVGDEFIKSTLPHIKMEKFVAFEP